MKAMVATRGFNKVQIVMVVETGPNKLRSYIITVMVAGLNQRPSFSGLSPMRTMGAKGGMSKAQIMKVLEKWRSNSRSHIFPVMVVSLHQRPNFSVTTGCRLE